MSRFFLTDAPALAPGVCWITRTSKGPFIDTGVDLSKNVIDRGRIYLSVEALREMAQLAGLFDEGEPKTAVLKKKQWYEEGYNDAMKELKSDVINNFVERVLTDSTVPVGAAVPVEPENNHTAAGAAVGNLEDAATGAPEVDKDTDGAELKSASTSRFKRPSRFSTNSSDESNFRL